MSVNVNKCCAVSFSRKNFPISFPYEISDLIIPRTTESRDLGVILDSRLTLQSHHESLVTKAQRCSGFVTRVAKKITDSFRLKSLYCALIRP